MEQQSPHKRLIVWQKSVDLAVIIYRIAARFPNSEKFALASQIQRAAVSVPSNIAEGSGRGTRRDLTQFLHVALGSAAELETQLDIARALSFVTEADYTESMHLLIEVRKMLVSMIKKLKL